MEMQMSKVKRIGIVATVAGLVAVVTATAGAATPTLPQGSEPVNLNPAEFTTQITNPYWPMTPGSRWVYREVDGSERLRVEVKVTNRTRLIANGITARVVRDVVTHKGVPVEVTDDWYAQDSAGNIWYLGEDTAEYNKHGKVVSRAGSFEAGVDGAQPGIIMPANPVDGMTYRQEYYAGHAEDKAEVLSLDEQVEVKVGHFPQGQVLMTKDINPLEPKVLEHKFYAKGVGPVLTLDVSGASGREELLRYHQGA
jgi:hypothetical protein